jgi:CheY-like chemotaxis protein
MFQILVVDDNLTNLDVISRMLQKAGYRVATAANGEQGVRMAAQWRYDLIVMDMRMPGISGGEATQQIRAAEKATATRRVPVVAFTADAVPESRQRAIRSDMDDFITKPIEFRQLLAAVERSLDNRTVVLVADDSAPDRDRAARYLRALDRVCVVTAGSGPEAIAACARQRITLALINLALPDIDGIPIATRIRTSESGREIGIVAINNQVDAEARQGSLNAGYAGYVEKPFTQPDIAQFLQPKPLPVSV